MDQIRCVALVRTHEGGYILTFSDGAEHHFGSEEELSQAARMTSTQSGIPKGYADILTKWSIQDPTMSHGHILFALTA